jgi:dihydroorotase
MIGFETTYAIANTILKEKMSTESIIEKFTNGVEKVIGEYCYGIEEENMANITFFDPDKRWVYTENDIKSKSKNTPFVDYDFIGKVLGIINKKKLNIN